MHMFKENILNVLHGLIDQDSLRWVNKQTNKQNRTKQKTKKRERKKKKKKNLERKSRKTLEKR